MQIKHALLSFILFFCSVSFQTHSQQSEELIKAALLFQFTNHVTWPTSSRDEFALMIYGESAIYDHLRSAQGRTVQGKPFKRYKTTNLNRLKQANIVYVPEESVNNLAEIYDALKGSSALLVTDESVDKTRVMINLTVIDDNIKFQVNRPNIIAAGLTIKKDLLLLGGTELDVVKVYREMQQNVQSSESALQDAQQKLVTTQENLKASQRQVGQIEQQIERLSKQVTAEQRKIKQQQKKLAETQAILISKNKELNEQSEELITTRQLYQELKTNITSLNNELRERQLELSNQQKNYQDVLDNVANSQNELNSLELQIKDKNRVLANQQSALDEKSKQLEKQQLTLNTTLGVTGVSLIATLFISILFIKNKRIAAELKRANENLTTTQKQLVQSEKFASLGQLVAGVAHELNTPIGIAITSTSFIHDEAKNLESKVNSANLKKKDLLTFIEHLHEAERITSHNLTRCANMLQSFKLVSADQAVAQERALKLSDYVAEIMSTLSVSLKRHSVEWSLEGVNPDVMLDPGILTQVINNVVMNATVHAFSDDSVDKQINIVITESDDYANITISDNGKGMDEKTLAKIYEPFFTTKRGAGGTGLGMNIVYNLVVQNMKGKVFTKSTIDQGTSVTIQIPLITTG